MQIEIPDETLKFFENDQLRARVFIEKYALKDLKMNLLEKTPEQMWKRVAKAISDVEKENNELWNEKFYKVLKDFRFVPGGRILATAGDPFRRKTPFNCYVSAIRDDSIEAIFTALYESARTYSWGGGWGTDLSTLRPRGAIVHNAASHSTGAVSFMNLFSEVTGTIGQDGRRGALMLMIRVDHPDAPEFITVKNDPERRNVRFANISLKITDEFMKAVENDEDFTLRFENDVVSKMERKVKARDLWNKIVKNAWSCAEPGVLFWDRIKSESPSEYFAPLVATNPCGEIPLEDGGACCLGSINLTKFVKEPFTEKASLDWGKLDETVRTATRFLDDVIEYGLDRQPLEIQRKAAENGRRIGLGTMGLADMLAMLRMRYDTPESIDFLDKLFDRIKNVSYQESTLIAREKGSFKAFNLSKHMKNPFVQRLWKKTRDMIRENGLRNVTLLSIAPTGSISAMAGVTSGIEPMFAFSYTRRSESLSQKEFKVYHPLVKKYMEEFNIENEDDLPDYFVSAHEVNPYYRVKLQGTIQKHVDNAISSTINLPNNASQETISDIYMQAWKAGCKGITVYRDGSRDAILSVNDKKGKKTKRKSDFSEEIFLDAKRIKLQTPKGSLYLTASFDSNKKLREVFVQIGKSGADEKADAEAIGRLISLYLQNDGDPEDVINTMEGIQGRDVAWFKGLKIYSLPDAIAKGLRFILQGKFEPRKEQNSDGFEICPRCGQRTLIRENGCYRCLNCLYSRCD